MKIDKTVEFEPDSEAERSFSIAGAIDEYLMEREIDEAIKQGDRTQVNVRLNDLALFSLDEVALRLGMSRSASAAFLLNVAISQARIKLIPFDTPKQAETFYQKFADSKGAELTGGFLFQEITK